MKVYICHALSKDADYLVEMNEMSGYEVLLDKETLEYYVEIQRSNRVYKKDEEVKTDVPAE